MRTEEKLGIIRRHMEEDGVDAVYVGTMDPHQSESVAAHWKAVQWLTGYSGSVGVCIITRTLAAFWTDGRYTTQARREIDEEYIKVYTVATPGEPEWDEWLLHAVDFGASMALDGSVMSVEDYRSFCIKLSEKKIQIMYEKDYVGEIWEDRPSIPTDPVYEQKPEYADRTRTEKLELVRDYMEEKVPGLEYYLVNCLDDIAWLTNLRGHDNPLYPFFHAYVLISKEKAWLCTDLKKLSESIKEHLIKDGYELREYKEMGEVLSTISTDASIYLDPFKTPYLLYKRIPDGVTIRQGMDFVVYLKSKKSKKEQENIRKANICECVAVSRFMKYIEENVAKEEFDEYQLGKKLEQFRRMNEHYLQPANLPIVGYGVNAALPHYRPNAQNTAKVYPKGFLLFDVCAQYVCGTTDLTRTVAVGDLTDEMRYDYTLTLKSHIALARQKFPYGTTGNILDGIVKAYHWNKLIQYKTGTGHGIGYVSNVHEGPCKIMMDYTSMFPYALSEPLDVGMLFSDEPGVYKPGRHGIRIENSVFVQEEEVNEFGRFLGFETITFLPYERKAIIVSELTEEERVWIDCYHKATYEKLSPYLTEEEKIWLKEKTAPLS